MIDIVKRRYLFFLISALVIVPGVISLILPPGLRLGIDFTGGTLWEIQFQRAVEPLQVKQVFADHGFADSLVQTTGTDTVSIRSKEIQADKPIKQQIFNDLEQKFGPAKEISFESVGPSVGTEIWQRSIMAVCLASLGILLYLWWAFRHVPRPYAYGLCAIIALLHDALVVVGIFSILGRLFNIEVDSLFITALLTVIGFSVHDTIVVFDRIRENMIRHAGERFETVVNHSLLQTLGRSLSTSLTVIFTLTALVLFGGVTTRTFALALLIGIVSGTYSSIFNASMLLVIWETGELRRLFSRLSPANASA